MRTVLMLLSSSLLVSGIAALCAGQTSNTIPIQVKPAANPLTKPDAQTEGCVPSDLASRRVLPLPPYTAEFRITTVRTLADGTIITQTSHEMQARDGAGDQVTTSSQIRELGARLAIIDSTNVHFADGDATLSWDGQRKVATRQTMPPRDQRQGCWADAAGNLRMRFGASAIQSKPDPALVEQWKYVEPERKTEQLGEDILEGVKVRGTRTTSTIPAGAIGNDRPLVTINETWTSRELQGVIMRSITDDPRAGKQVREVTSLKLGEPDPALFAPPAGYTVKVFEVHQVPCTNE